MKNNQLIFLLKSFDRKEMTRFKDFSLSPYHHKHEASTALVCYLHSIYPKFTDKNVDRFTIWKKLFPTTAFDNAKLALLFTYAWRLAEQFLAQEHLKKDSAYQSLALLKELRQKEQWSAYERQWKNTQKQMDKRELQDLSFFKNKLALAKEANQTYIQKARRKQDVSLHNKAAALDQYYILEKLQDAIELQVRKHILPGDYSARLLEAILHELDQNPDTYLHAPAIQVYYLLHKMMEAKDLSSYRKALEVFQLNESIFENKELAAIYIYLQNFCIARINENKRSFLREIFQLYQDQLERKLLHEDGYLIEWHYKNIVTTGIRLEEMDWVRDFIELYKHEIKPESAENAYRFNKAAYSYAVGEMDQVLELLTQVEYKDLRYNIGAKVLLLRVYYEENEFEALDALVESFRQYLQRSKLMASSLKKGYYEVFRITRRLAKIKNELAYSSKEKQQQSLQKVVAELKKTQVVFNKHWLEGKVKELELLCS